MSRPSSSQAARTHQTTMQTVFPPPEPLMRETAADAPFPIHALPSVLAEMGALLQEGIQAPAALIGQSLLAGAALATQGFADVVIDESTQFPLSLYCVTIAESGERKTSVDKAVLRPHAAFQKAEMQTYRAEMQTYRAERMILDKARERIAKIKKKAQRDVELAELGSPPIAPALPLVLVEEPTYEGMAKLLAIARPSIGLFSSEGGRFVGGYAMSKDHHLKTAAGLSSLWDGSPITRVRSTDMTQVLYGRRLSLHLMMQPRLVANRFLGSQTLHDQGLLSRILLAVPASTMGNRPYKAVALWDDPRGKIYRQCLDTILHEPLVTSQTPDDGLELEPRPLMLDPQAQTDWKVFHDAIEARLAPKQALEPVKAFAAKTAEHAARIAGVLTLLENLQADRIPGTAMRAGIELARWYLNEALRLVCVSTVDQDLQDAQRLLEWLYDQGADMVYPAMVYNNNWTIRTKARAVTLLQIPEEHEHLLRLENMTEIDGRKRRLAWKVLSHPSP